MWCDNIENVFRVGCSFREILGIGYSLILRTFCNSVAFTRRNPEFESQRAHPDSLIKTRNRFDSDKASFIRVSMTLEALLPLFLSNEMVSFDKVR